ncbi:hypothetical protein AEGHOMDF_4301 [Methylobacterium soli]|nr:hypothetical protein AEGHOMDF_4301 [Methylobacterium soli]
MRTGRVLAGLRPPDLRGHRTDPLDAQQLGRDQGAEALRFLQRGAGCPRHMEDQVSFLEIGQEGPAEEGGKGRPRQRQHHAARDDDARVAIDTGQEPPIDALRPTHHRRVAALDLPLPSQQQHGERGRDGERHPEGGNHGQDVGEAQGAEQAAGDARQGKDREEHQKDREGRVGHSRAHLEDRVEHHPPLRPRLAQAAVLAQAPHHVLDADYRVVHHLADGDGEAAERHGVEALAERLERQDGRDQRERNGDGADHAGAPIVQEGEQHHDDEEAAERQGLQDVVVGDPDEVRGPEQVRPQGHPLALQGGAQILEGCLDAGGDLARVGAVLGADHQEDPGLAVDQGGTDRRLGRRHDIGHIAQHHARPALVDEDRAGDLRRCQRLPLGLEHDALVGRVDEARPPDAGGLAGRREHVVEPDPEPDQVARTHLHLQRAHPPAVDRDLGDPRDREEAQPHGPVGEGAQLQARPLLRCQADEQHRAG